MKPRGFTLIELLVVVAIIIALLAILMPSMGIALRRAEEAVCATDTRTLSQVTLNYASDYYGVLPDLNRRPTNNSQATNIYWSWSEWREIFEDTYGVQRQNWFSVSNTSWSGDELYYWGWNGADPDTATHMVMGRFYLSSDLANSDTFYNAMTDPPPADARPLFARRISDRSYFKVVWADLNREWPDNPGVIDWATPGAARIGANHLYSGDTSSMPEGSHLGYLDGSVRWSNAGEMKKRSTISSAAIWW